MSYQQYTVRHAESFDIEAIDEIYNQAIAKKYTAHLSPLEFKERHTWFLRHQPGTYPVLVAICDKMVVGWISLSPYREGRMALRYTVEISFYVHAAFHRKGIGSVLLKAAIDRAKELGYRVLFAIILEHNSPSISLLENFNFTQWGFLPEVADFDGMRFGQYYYGRCIS